MYNKIYIYSPATPTTGGTELLQQLAAKLRKIGQNAYMVYTTPYENSPVQKIFGQRYGNPFVTEIEDSENNIMIVDEGRIQFLLAYKKIQKAVWWLSVDNYRGAFRIPMSLIRKSYYYVFDKIFSLFFHQWLHFVQSEYAYDYCTKERKISNNQVFRLSDYLSQDFIKNGRFKDNETSKENAILYNPKKGMEFTKKLIGLAPELNWIPIQNMTAKEVSELMNKSKVYIDFGHHPGKDRIPREAAICGCCVITGLRGSANNDIDIPISSKYKFPEKDPQAIIKEIKSILDNYEDKRSDYDGYIEKILEEERVFENEVSSFFTKEVNITISNEQSYLTDLKHTLLRPLIYMMKIGPNIFRK